MIGASGAPAAGTKMGIAATGAGLTMDSRGIWTSSRSVALSYPEAGNERCFGLEDSSFWFTHRNDCIVALVRRFPPTGCILDVGGGNGYVTKRLIDEGFDAALLEPGPVGAWNGKEGRQIPEVICSTLEDAGFPQDSVPAMACFDVIEHIQDDRAFLDHVRNLLVPSGLLYATVPAHRWLWSHSDVVAQHHRRYNRAELDALLRENGFEPKFSSYFFLPLTLPILLLRALPFRLGLVRQQNVLSDEAEHGVSGGVVAATLRHMLRFEAERIARGVESRFGASVLFAAQKRR